MYQIARDKRQTFEQNQWNLRHSCDTVKTHGGHSACALRIIIVETDLLRTAPILRKFFGAEDAVFKLSHQITPHTEYRRRAGETNLFPVKKMVGDLALRRYNDQELSLLHRHHGKEMFEVYLNRRERLHTLCMSYKKDGKNTKCFI